MFKNYTFKRNVKATLRRIWSKLTNVQDQVDVQHGEHERRFAGHASLFTTMDHRFTELSKRMTAIENVLGPVWTTKSGHAVTPKFMSDDHIERMLRSNFPGSEMRHGLELERERREENAKWEARSIRTPSPIEARLDQHTHLLNAVGADIEQLRNSGAHFEMAVLDSVCRVSRKNEKQLEAHGLIINELGETTRKQGTTLVEHAKYIKSHQQQLIADSTDRDRHEGRISQLESRAQAATKDRRVRAKKANERIDILQFRVSKLEPPISATLHADFEPSAKDYKDARNWARDYNSKHYVQHVERADTPSGTVTGRTCMIHSNAKEVEGRYSGLAMMDWAEDGGSASVVVDVAIGKRFENVAQWKAYYEKLGNVYAAEPQLQPEPPAPQPKRQRLMQINRMLMDFRIELPWDDQRRATLERLESTLKAMILKEEDKPTD